MKKYASIFGVFRYYLAYNKARIFKNRYLKFDFKLKPASLFTANETYV